MANPESRFRQAIHRHLSSRVHHESSKAIMSNGTPDDYYESLSGLARIEYKHYPKCPVRANMDLVKGNSPKLSALQQAWLWRAYHNGQPVYVVVGFGTERAMRGVILYSPEEWLRPWSPAELKERMRTPAELAKVIDQVLVRGLYEQISENDVRGSTDVP
jgi:hypothetical protein